MTINRIKVVHASLRSVWLPVGLFVAQMLLLRYLRRDAVAFDNAWPILQIGSGALLVAALHWVRFSPRMSGLGIFLRLTLWSGVWVILPTTPMLKLFAWLAFVGMSACRWMVARDAPTAWERLCLRWPLLAWVTCMVIGAALVAITLPHVMSRLGRLWWPSSPDWTGLHFEARQVQATVDTLTVWGPAAAPLNPFVDRIEGAALLQMAQATGWLPAALLLLAMLGLWLGLAAWLCRMMPGQLLSDTARRLGMVVALMHALATALNAWWAFGGAWLPLGFGLLPLVRHGSWWVLSLTLAWVVRKAWLQYRMRSPST